MSLLSQARSHYDVCYKVILAYVLETLGIMTGLGWTKEQVDSEAPPAWGCEEKVADVEG